MTIFDYVEQLWHAFNDVITFFGWFFSNLINFFEKFFLLFNYIFQFLKSFFQTAFIDPIAPETIWAFPTGVINIFHAIPYWTTITQVLGIAFLVIFTIFILKNFLHV